MLLRNILACGVTVALVWGVCPAQTTQPAGGSPRPTTAPAAAGAPAAVEAEGQGAGTAALQRAAEAKKYLFVFFFKDGAEKTVAMRKVVDGAVAKAADKATTIAIDVNDAAEKEIVARYGVAAAPMPLVLAIAPNGAITGGFPAKFEEKDLLGAFATPGMEQSLKALQGGKLVLLCAQNKTTKLNEEASKGVREFVGDKRFATFTVLVQIDPADAAEAKFLAQLQIGPQTQEAVTVLLAPPGMVVSTVKGKVDKEAMVKALLAAISASCPPGACGPGGCGPTFEK